VLVTGLTRPHDRRKDMTKEQAAILLLGLLMVLPILFAPVMR
jgi:hypothetical protein